MKLSKMKNLFIVILITTACSCEYVAPQTSKAISENQQLEEMKRHNAEVERLMKEQNEILKTK